MRNNMKKENKKEEFKPFVTNIVVTKDKPNKKSSVFKQDVSSMKIEKNSSSFFNNGFNKK